MKHKIGKYVIVDEYGNVVNNQSFSTKTCAEDFLRRYRLGKNDDGLKVKQIHFPILPTNWKK